MKKIYYFLIALNFILISNILFADVIISGIDVPTTMNGTYTQVGTYNNRPYYELSENMETYSLFYLEGMPSQWIILRADGPFEHGMWALYGCGFYIVSSATLPPASGYNNTCWGMGMFSPVTGDPHVQHMPPIPVSLWVVVAVFITAGGFLVYRYYRKQAKVA